jgi:NUMOD3 motif
MAFPNKKLSEETKLKISKANKGKRLGSVPWNKGKKLHYITGKREHSEQTRQRMSIAASGVGMQASKRMVRRNNF